MAPDPLANLYLGETLAGRYNIRDFIAAGGFCLVFRAKDLVDDRDVAVKVLKPGAAGEAVLEFQTEGLLLEMLRHRSHVLKLLGAASNTDTVNVCKPGLAVPLPLPVHFIVVELADACLADLVANRAAVSWAARLALLRDVVLGVHQMHLGMIVHRDIKSENALVTIGPGSRVRACIADLGRGRNLHEPARFLADDYLTGRGDLRFAPPELLHLTGTDSPIAFRRADTYLLGSALFELCTGQGITSLVYGDPRTVLASAVAVDPARRSTEYKDRIIEHRARFEPAFLLAESELPSHLRYETGRLLRQLCDADPSARERRSRVDVNQPVWGLNWIIRRVDILCRLEKLSRVAGRRAGRRVA